MTELFNKIEILGVEIERETQVNAILKTSSDSFKQFKHNMNKMVMSVTELMMGFSRTREVFIW